MKYVKRSGSTLNTKPLKKVLGNAVSKNYKCPFPYCAQINGHTSKRTCTPSYSQSGTFVFTRLLVKSQTLMLPDVYTEFNTLLYFCRHKHTHVSSITQRTSLSFPFSLHLMVFCKLLTEYMQESRNSQLDVGGVFCLQGSDSRLSRLTVSI